MAYAIEVEGRLLVDPNRVEFSAWSSSTRSCNDTHASLGNNVTAGNYAAGGPATGAGDEQAAAAERMWKRAERSGAARPRMLAYMMN